MRTSILALFLLACGSDGDPKDARSKPVPVDQSDWPEEIGSPDRPAKLLFPTGVVEGEELPLIVLLHGFGVNASLQDAVYQLANRVESHRFALLMPNGTENANGERFWNATEVCCGYGSDVDDSGYLRGLVEEAEAAIPIDPARIYFTGHSNGGYMSYRMACDHSDMVAAIAPLAGVTFRDEADCEAADPVSVLHSHGTADTSVPFEDIGWGPSAEASVRFWADRGGCGPGTTKLGRRDYEVLADGKETVATAFDDGCDPDFAAELWAMEGVGHLPAFNESWRDDLVDWLLARRKL